MKWYYQTMTKRHEIIEKLRAFFDKVAREYDVDAAFLYGSWAQGLPRPDSDIDVALVFRGETTDEAIFERVNRVTRVLEESLGAEVNVLVIYPDFRRPMLYHNAVSRGIPVYVADLSRLAKLRNETLFQMEDFSIFGNNWKLKAARRNLGKLKRA